MKKLDLIKMFFAAIVVAACAWAQGPWTVDGVTHTLASGTLTISGTGDVEGWNLPDWRDYETATNITIVNIGDGISNIDYGVFNNCENLTAINVDEGNTAYNSYGGILYDKNMSTLILCPIGKTGTVTIPDGVASIGYNAFEGCSGLTEIIIPESVTSISEGAFLYCSNLTEITIPNGVISIGWFAFQGAGITSITIPESVTSVEGPAFNGCSNLTAINVDAGNTAYSSYEGILYDKNMAALIRSPEGKTGTVIIPDGVISIGPNAFLGNSHITSVVLPHSITSIEANAFRDCSLTEISVGKNVTEIEDLAFMNCENLTTIIVFNPVPPTIYQNTFYTVSPSVKIYVPKNNIATYQTAQYWSSLSNIVAITGEFAVRFSAGSNGTISATAEDAAITSGDEIEFGTDVIFTAVPANGYYTSVWKLNGLPTSNTGNVYALTVTEEAEVTVEFATNNYDMSGVTFADKTVTYNGQAHSIEISGELPIGVSVTYTGNGQTDAGTYTVTANFAVVNSNYNVPTSMTATLKIDKANPPYTTPTGLTATVGQTLATVALPSGWSWVTSTDLVGVVGNQTHKAKFTPSNVANYNILNNIDVTVTVSVGVGISDVKKSGNGLGIIFEKNVVSDELKIVIVALPDGKDGKITSVVIYDNTGNVVFNCEGNKPWDLRNKSGRIVANGSYLVIVEAKYKNDKSYWYSAKVGVYTKK